MKKPILKFSGNEFAHDMGAVFAENLADLVAKVEMGKGSFPKGFIHTSTLPHEGTCYYDQIWARDAGRGLNELARYGYIDEADAVADYFLSHKNFGDHWGRLVDRHFDLDYELDGNTHILHGLYQLYISSGKEKSRGKRYVTECLEVFQWMERLMTECPFAELIPCISELSGNPCENKPVYAIYPNYGALCTMRAFAQIAEECLMDDEQRYLSQLANRLEKSIFEQLVSTGNPDISPVPEHVWLNGFTADHQPFETAFFGAWFPITHWTRQLPFIQLYDRGIKAIPNDHLFPIHMNSYAYIRHEMASNIYFRKYGFVSNTCWTGCGGRHDDTMCGYGQNYFTQAALMTDDINTYGKCLEGIARLAYDGDIIEPMTFEMNPYILHECFALDNYDQALDHTFGTHPDGAHGVADNPGDEGNLVQACETLKTLALVAGISMKDGILYVCPKLPWKWDSMELEDYPVVDSDGTVHHIALRYEHDRSRRNCKLHVTSPDGIRHVHVRFGPFPAVTSTQADLSDFQREDAIGGTFFHHEGGLVQSIEL